MAIAAPSQPAPALPAQPPTDQLELAFGGLQGIRDDLAGFLEDPFYEPLRAGIDGQLARLYRAITAPDRLARSQPPVIVPGSWAVRPDYDAPTGAGDDIRSVSRAPSSPTVADRPRLVFGQDKLCAKCKGTGVVGPKDDRRPCGTCTGTGLAPR